MHIKNRGLQLARTLCAMVLAIVFVMGVVIGFSPIDSAHAASVLKAGEYRALSEVPGSSDYNDGLLGLKVKSSDTSVISCGVRKPSGYTGSKEYFAHAKGFGKATVTATWKVAETVFNAKTKKYSQKKRNFSKCFEFEVKEAALSASKCDYLFSGSSYSLSSLFKKCRADNHVSYFPKQSDGVFEKGQGYSVVGNGKKIKFSQAGKGLSVLYKVKGKTYRIKVGVVHSKESLKEQTIIAVKKAAYVPSSFRLKGVQMRGYKVVIRFSLVNLVGATVTSKVSSCYQNGEFAYQKIG